MERKPIEEMTRYDEITEFGIISAPIIALHCDWHNEDKKRDVFRAIRAYADRQNEALRPRPMSEMPDEYRDGRYVLLWEGDKCISEWWFDKKWDGWFSKTFDWRNVEKDTEFTHFMLTPTIEEN